MATFDLKIFLQGEYEHARDIGVAGAWLQSPGGFLPASAGYQTHADLDGTAARAWLESQGYVVKLNYDTGRCGLAITACGMRLSTNGHIIDPSFKPAKAEA